MSILDAATTALRDEALAAGEGRADATRARLVRSLERRAHRRRQTSAVVTVLVLLLGATASWAWGTGRLDAWFGRGAAPSEVPPAPRPVPAASAVSAGGPAPSPGLLAVPAPPPVAQAVPAPEVWPAPTELEPPRAPVKKPARPVRPAEALYRRAHELHFRGTDHVAALAAWDAYLAAEASGTFAIEARFNRGLLLARLARYPEALVALEPFARGEIADGYRQAEATALVARLRALVEAP